MMSGVVTTIAGVAIVGIGATVIMDIWAIIQKRLFGIIPLDYRLVGRWIGHFRKGRFFHDGIGKAEVVPGEISLGWAAHYLTGIVFAAALIGLWGAEWLRHPTLLPALVIGIGSVVVPFFVMQPGFGVGIAASRTPKPWVARFRSLVAHTSFAVGLYLSALVFSEITAALTL